jgi:hypothetical protein
MEIVTITILPLIIYAKRNQVSSFLKKNLKLGVSKQLLRKLFVATSLIGINNMSLLKTTDEIHQVIDKLIITQNATNSIIKRSSDVSHWRCVWERRVGNLIRYMIIYSICKRPDCSDVPLNAPPYQFRCGQNMIPGASGGKCFDALRMGDSDYVLQFFSAWMIDCKEWKNNTVDGIPIFKKNRGQTTFYLSPL